MNKEELIASGLLELYVLGETEPQEDQLIENLVLVYPELRRELNEIELSLESLALANAVTPDPIVKPFLLATLDYIDRIKNGEDMIKPPLLNENSIPEDYNQWLNRADLKPTEQIEDVFAKIIYAVPGLTTAIVWIKYMAPQEVHDDEYESFLILEGTCNIYVEEEVFSLQAGDVLTVPLHKNHHVLVTSEVPCKVILQRLAA